MKTTMGIACAAIIAAGVLAPEAGARQPSERQKSPLVSTGVDADARGGVELQVRNASEARFEIVVEHLDARATYEVLADDVAVGQLTTNARGRARIRFRTRPRTRRDVLLGFDPRGALVTVRDVNGEDVLAIMLASASTPSDSPNVVCCVPDDRGPECEDRTADECAAQGGTVSSAASCLPNPCAGAPAPPATDVVCCIPDDSGPECEDRTPAECAQQGGVIVAASSCAPNPCAPIAPPGDSDIQCCLPDDSGPECEDRTPAECAAQGGVNMGPGSCTPNPCGATPASPPAVTATVRITCERRANRSKISVDGRGLPAGSYSARVVSGANEAVSAVRAAVGDEAEFDFDSDRGDIAASATAIIATFLQGTPPQATGQIRDAQGNLVAEMLATCAVK
jgi:hypothetical protein